MVPPTHEILRGHKNKLLQTDIVNIIYLFLPILTVIAWFESKIVLTNYDSQSEVKANNASIVKKYLEKLKT